MFESQEAGSRVGPAEAAGEGPSNQHQSAARAQMIFLLGGALKEVFALITVVPQRHRGKGFAAHKCL